MLKYVLFDKFVPEAPLASLFLKRCFVNIISNKIASNRMLKNSGGDLAPSLGDGIFWAFFADQAGVFSKKFPFSRPKFLMTYIFSHRPYFSDLPFLFADFPYLFYIKCRKSPFPQMKNTPFLLCS